MATCDLFVDCSSIEGSFHISHRVPVCTGNSFDEIIRLFYLSNLSVAHPYCNLSLGSNVVPGYEEYLNG